MFSPKGVGHFSRTLRPRMNAEPSDITAKDEPAPAAQPRRVTTRRVLIASGFIIIALITSGGLIVLALTQDRPRWWKSLDISDPKTIATAQAVENGIATALTQVRPSPTFPSGATSPAASANKPWKVFITTDQANAWLNVRLRGWLQDQAEQGRPELKWPPEVGQMQVRFDGGRIDIGAVVTRPPPSDPPKLQTLAASLHPEFREDGSFWLIAETITIGRLGLPASWVLPSTSASGTDTLRTDKLKDVSAQLASLPQSARLLSALAGQVPVLSRPIIRLGDGRRVRLLDIRAEGERLVITCQTEERQSTLP